MFSPAREPERSRARRLLALLAAIVAASALRAMAGEDAPRSPRHLHAVLVVAHDTEPSPAVAAALSLRLGRSGGHRSIALTLRSR